MTGVLSVHGSGRNRMHGETIFSPGLHFLAGERSLCRNPESYMLRPSCWPMCRHNQEACLYRTYHDASFSRRRRTSCRDTPSDACCCSLDRVHLHTLVLYTCDECFLKRDGTLNTACIPSVLSISWSASHSLECCFRSNGRNVRSARSPVVPSFSSLDGFLHHCLLLFSFDRLLSSS